MSVEIFAHEIIDYRFSVQQRTPNGEPGLLYRFFESAADARAYMEARPLARLVYHFRAWHPSFIRYHVNNGHVRFMRRGADGFTESTDDLA
jgi:hypothetical protein